jgi:hypothetical protein
MAQRRRGQTSSNDATPSSGVARWREPAVGQSARRRAILAHALASHDPRRARRGPRRRLAASPAGAAAPEPASGPAAPLRFPRDFGAHPEARTEWWYITGVLAAGARVWGFQITFFRAATGVVISAPSRFAARQLLFAHGAVTDLAARRLRHDQRIARSGFGIAEAGVDDTALVLRDWRLARGGGAGASRYSAQAKSDRAGFAYELEIAATQPVVLQGENGVSRKGPRREQTSRYYSEPQLAVRGTLRVEGRPADVTGRAWLDHEWSDAYLDPGRRRLGLDRHEPRRRQRADGVSHAPRRRQHAVERRQPSPRGRRDARLRERGGRLHARPHLGQPGVIDALSGRMAGRDAGRTFGVRALLDDQELDSRTAPARSTGKACRCSSTPPARRSGAAISR